MQRLRPVYIAASGHCSARGLTPAAAATAMLAGATGSSQRRVADRSYPFFRMPLPQQDWLARAEAALHASTADIRTRLTAAQWRKLPVFFASSSFQIGLHEQPGTPPHLPPGAASFAVQAMRWLGLEGAPQCFSSACTSSMMALDAAAWLAHGVAPQVLVITAELENQLTANGFYSLGLLGDACRPLDARRNGMVLGEAVAAVLLCADDTGANTPRWRLSGSAPALDASSLTGMDVSGAPIAAAMHAALQQARLQPSDIGLVKLHAAGVPGSDAAEARALQQLFGRTPLPPLLSLKPYLGHTLGASGLAELTALLACLEQGQIPATPGCDMPDPALGLRPTRCAQPASPAHTLLLGLGFGGSIHASIVSREPA